MTGNLTGTASAIPDLIVSTAKVQDSAVTTAKVQDSAVTTAKIAANAVTSAKLGTNENLRIAKAWVNFDGSVGMTSATAIPNTHTLTASAGGSTLTWNGTGLVAPIGTNWLFTISGSSVIGGIDIGTSGNRLIVTSTSSTVVVLTLPAGVTFTSAVSHTANGSNSTYRMLSSIRSSYNVSSITKIGTGNYSVNYTTFMSDANYASNIAIGNSTAAPAAQVGYLYTPNQGVNLLQILVSDNNTDTLQDATSISVIIFGN